MNDSIIKKVSNVDLKYIKMNLTIFKFKYFYGKRTNLNNVKISNF